MMSGKKLLEKPRFELALTVKGAFRPGRSYIFGQGVSRSLGQRPGKKLTSNPLL